MFRALGSGFWSFRLFFFFGGAFEVEGEEAFEDLLVGEIGRPAVRRGDGGGELFVGEVEPGRPLVVEIFQKLPANVMARIVRPPRSNVA